MIPKQIGTERRLYPLSDQSYFLLESELNSYVLLLCFYYIAEGMLLAAATGISNGLSGRLRLSLS